MVVGSMMRGGLLYLIACFVPCALYVTQPAIFLGLLLLGLFTALVVFMPVGSRPKARRSNRSETERSALPR